MRGYPTLKIFKSGELSSDYNGPREAAGITKFMRSQVGPASKEIKTVEEAEKILAKDEVVVFGFGAADAGIMKTFAKTADKLRQEYMFAHTSEEAVMKKLGQKEGSVVLFRPKHHGRRSHVNGTACRFHVRHGLHRTHGAKSSYNLAT